MHNRSNPDHSPDARPSTTAAYSSVSLISCAMTRWAVVIFVSLCLPYTHQADVHPSSEWAKKCLCNSQDSVACLPTDPLGEVKTVLTGVCDNRHGCVQRIEPSATPTARFFCSSTDVEAATEYSIVNGKLETLSHECNDSHCLPTLLPSIERCEWRMSPTDQANMLNLKCHCNNGDRCVDGTCDFSKDTVLLPGQFPACRYWWEADWKEPMIDCWLASRAQDRAMFFDHNTVHLICRDGDHCNNAEQVDLMVRSDEHCPAFLTTIPLNKAVHKHLGVDVFKIRNLFATAESDEAATKSSVTHKIRHRDGKIDVQDTHNGSEDKRDSGQMNGAVRSIPAGRMQDAAVGGLPDQPIPSVSAAMASTPEAMNVSSPSMSLMGVEAQIDAEVTNAVSSLRSSVVLCFSVAIVCISCVVLAGH
uniref:Uncharacterized protein n=1 Tax=Plectus sambesii TaxID=2011161 RepID=A0A914WXC3_9BILA